MASQAEVRLRELARQASVAILSSPGEEAAAEFWGSGLLIAPGWVLTCAHVLVRRDRYGRRHWAGDRELGIRVESRVVPGRAVYALPGPGELAGWEFGDEREYELSPDLALVRLLEPVRHGCAWLSDRAVPPVSSQVAAIGWRRPERELEPWDGTCTGNDRIDVFRLGPDSEIPPGVSGSLVVDLQHGRVVGVVKARRRSRDGGKAVLLTALRALAGSEPLAPEHALGPDPYQALVRGHDRWHYEQHRAGADRTWIDVQGALPGVIGEWTPFERVAALGLLAELPPPAGPGVVQRVVEQVLGPGTVRDPLPRSWRDGHGLLYEPDDGRQRFAFLAYLTRVAVEVRGQDEPRAAELLAWAQSRGLSLPVHERAQLRELAEAPPARASVVVALAPVRWRGERPDRFWWEIQLVRAADDRQNAGVCDDRDGVTFDTAVAQLRAPLQLALDRADGSGPPAPVELAVPVECFDTAAHTWTPDGSDHRRPALPMGARRPVVVRDLERGGPGGVTPEWRYRWTELTAQHRLSAYPLALTDPSPGYEPLRSAPVTAVPVLCGPAGTGPGLDVMLDVLRAGHGVALWRTGPHPPGPCGPECADFHRRVDEALRQAPGAAALPEVVRALRAAADGQAGTGWAREVALLYDDASVPLPGYGRPDG
jgi:hypothetical protein